MFDGIKSILVLEHEIIVSLSGNEMDTSKQINTSLLGIRSILFRKELYKRMKNIIPLCLTF